ncbi:MAG: Clp protease ClpP [Gammaproteobacteria bacterium]|nr:Clp protease ClpP [Gammaproteobacteria bacterium]
MILGKHRDQRTAESVARFWGKTLSKDEKQWYSINTTNSDQAEILIYDVIGWPFIDAETFVRELTAINAPNIKVRINSPGGDVMDGTAIYNALRAHPAQVTTVVEGMAASMASVIALAGDHVEIADNAYFMIHNPWTIGWGDEHALRDIADLLGRIGNTLAQTYAKKTGSKVADIKALMDAETWFIGSEAKDAGFVDAVVGDVEATARFELGMFDHAPKALKSAPRSFAENPPSAKELEQLLRDAGFSRSQSAAITSNGHKAIRQRDADEDVLLAIQNLTLTMNTGEQL